MAGDGFLALGRDGLEFVIAAFHGVPSEGDVAEEAEAEGFEVIAEQRRA